MSNLILSPRLRGIVVATSLLLIVGLATLASGQVGASKPPTRRFEYVHQEIQANSLTQSLNELDAQGWDVFQVVPSWQIKNENAETILSPRAYEIFGRRAIAPK